MAAVSAKNKSTIKSIFVIVGQDNFLVAGEYERLLEGLLKPEERAMSLYIAEARKVTAADILDELRTIPFLSPNRVVLIKDADDFVSDNRRLLEDYFDKPSKTGILIMTVSKWPSNTRLAKKLNSIGKLIKINQMTTWQLPGYATTYAKDKYNKT